MMMVMVMVMRMQRFLILLLLSHHLLMLPLKDLLLSEVRTMMVMGHFLSWEMLAFVMLPAFMTPMFVFEFAIRLTHETVPPSMPRPTSPRI
jgi:hypothetical protein